MQPKEKYRNPCFLKGSSWSKMAAKTPAIASQLLERKKKEAQKEQMFFPNKVRPFFSVLPESSVHNFCLYLIEHPQMHGRLRNIVLTWRIPVFCRLGRQGNGWQSGSQRSCFHITRIRSLMFKHGFLQSQTTQLWCSTTYKVVQSMASYIFLNLSFLICKSYLSICISVCHVSPRGLFEN